MSGNHPEKNNDNSIDGFNLSKEELMNCFGSQICSQSSDSNYDYQDDYIPSDIQRKNIGQNQFQPPQLKRELMENNNNSKKLGNSINKDDLLRNICHGFVDMFFSQKEELRGIKEEIKKLQNIMINNNNNNKKPITKKEKYNNNANNNEGFNYTFKNSKKNIFLNNNNLLVEEQNNQINIPKKENKKDQKKQMIPILGNSKLYRQKSPNIRANQKSSVPETVLEVEEEYELTSTNKQNKIKEKQKENQNQNKKENINNKAYEDPFYEESENFKFEDINDDEFDAILKRGKNKNDKKSFPLLGNDPFQKSSELKKRPNKNLENEEIDLENNINDNLNNDKNLGIINFESDEIISDFMAGGKRINIKLNDDIRHKMNTLDEPLDKLEELDKNKQPSNIIHTTSKLSCTSIMSKGKNINDSDERLKELNSKFKPIKRNYNTMLENSKKISENENSKNGKSKKNGSSAKERGLFQKTLKRYGKATYEVSSKLNISSFKNNSNPNSLNNTQNNNTNNTSIKKIKQKIKNKKYMYSTISSCQFYCLCAKNNYNNDNKKCEICKDIGIINIKNFMIGFYFYIINNKETNKNIEIDTSDSTFNLLKFDSLPENDKNFTQFKELEQFFNYQFVLLSYDKYLKISRESNNNELQIENLIEEIYDKLIPKYSEIFIKGKRSFLGEICEGETTLGNVNILLFLMNINKNPDLTTGEITIEFSDGYKSCYALINKQDPINKLLDKVILTNWKNVEIGMSKVLNITEDFKLLIKIYYNSISPSEYNDLNSNCPKYGPLLEKKFLPKNILEIKNDGGEISLIKVIIIKKYDFYVKNITKKKRYSRKKYEDEMMKIPDVSSDRKNYNNSDSGGKNNNTNETKEQDLLIINFKAIAMDYEIYNILKKNGNKKNLEHFLKKRYIIEFSIKYKEFYENIMEGKMYELMYLNMDYKNNNNINSNNNNNIHNANHYSNKNPKDNAIKIKYNDSSQINEIQLNLNYKTEKEYIDCIELINKHLNLTNNIDIGKLFIENEENNKQINNDDYLNKEFCISGIYSGYIDKINSNSSSEKNTEENKGGNEGGENDEYIERYIFLSFGIEKIAILKLHKEDFFNIDVKSNSIKDKIFNCSDILYKEILYFDNDNNQPKITGRTKLENSIPLLSLETNSYSSILFGNYVKNKEQVDAFIKYKEKNKPFIDMLTEAIGN